MTGVLLFKEKLKSFYGKNDMFIVPVVKFLLAFITICLINGNVGYMGSLDSVFVAIIVSLLCAVLPNGATVLFVTLIMIAHFYALSMELAVVTLIVFVLMYLFYFKFTAKSSAWLIVTLLCCMLKIPYVVPVAAGLLSGVFTMIPVFFGVIMYYFMNFAKEFEKTVATMEEGDMFDNFLLIIEGMLDKEILLIGLSFALTIVVVYLVRRLSIDYSWIYAVVAGSLTDFVMLLVGNVIFGTDIGFVGILLGLILSIVVGYVLNILFFGVDYTRTENVQYEDDTYYYYVKAVPKYSVSTADVKVKKINTQHKRRPVESDFDDIDIDF